LRPIDEDTLRALAGSRPADSFIVWAWRDGSLVVPEPLQVLNWSASDDAGDSVTVGQKVSLTVADPDGSLGAWRFDDPLGVGGTWLQLIYKVGGGRALNFARLRVTSNEPTEMVEWREIPEYGLEEPDSLTAPHMRMVPVTTAVVKLEAVDLTFDVDRDKLEDPESPESDATVLSEFRRLVSDYFPVVVDAGVEDVDISRLTIFEGERLQACQDLADRVSARYRMGGDGECHVYPRAVTPVQRFGPNEALVSVSRKQTLNGLYNRWIVEGKDSTTDEPVRGVVSIETGPLRYGGPHGRHQFKYTSEMITNGTQARAYAFQLRDKFLSSLAIELTLETAPWPQGQAGDRIEVACPVAAGYLVNFPGDVTSISRSGATVPGGTTLTVQCSYADVVAALGRTDWAQHLTGNMPELTWDRMPGTWGSLPAIEWDEL